MQETWVSSGFKQGPSKILCNYRVIIGFSRIIPVLISTFLGQLGDQWNPRQVLLFSEILAAFSSMGLWLGWGKGVDGYFLVLIFMVMRSVFVSFQAGSRAKIAKLLSEDTYQSNAKNAMWLNKATQGATLFAGALGWIAISYLDFTSVIVFDATTFLINGFIVYKLVLFDKEKGVQTQQSIHQKFSDLYRFSRKAAVLDLFRKHSLKPVFLALKKRASLRDGGKGDFVSLKVLASPKA